MEGCGSFALPRATDLPTFRLAIIVADALDIWLGSKSDKAITSKTFVPSRALRRW